MSAPTVEDVLPLSPLQHGLLFHAALDAGDPSAVDVYVAQLVLDLDGPLDPARLRRALTELARRHPVLRSAIVTDIGDPVQVVLSAPEIPWTEIDLRGHPDAEAEATRLVEADRRTRFDLGTPPLIRFLVLATGPDRHRVVLTNHHVITDGWSTPLLMRELFTLYAGGALPGVRPYRDYLGWLHTRDTAASVAAWRSVLDGVEEPTLLAPAARGMRAALPGEVSRTLPDELGTALTGLARDTGVTLNTVLQAGWGLLAGILTGRRDVVFGATVSGRPAELAGVESMVGLFINTIPVRIDLRPGDPVRALLNRVQAEQAAMLDHHHVGLAEINRALGAEGELFDSLLVYESFPFDAAAIDEAQRAAGLRAASVHRPISTHYPLTLMAVPQGRGLGLTLKHHPEAVGDRAADELLDRLVRVLTAMTVAPDEPVARVHALRDDERRPQAVTAPVGPIDRRTLPELFAAQVARTPDAPALSDGATTLTYAELGARVNGLAHRLVEHGVRPGDRVALLLPRSADQVVAALGVLAAGAAYVPIDPDQPRARIRFVLDDAAPVAVVATTTVDGDLPTIAPDAPSTPDAPPVRLRPDLPAYVIYTSGSTGTPKGVVVGHDNVVALLAATREEFAFGPHDVWTLFHSYAFDFSVWELCAPLSSGGRLVVVPYEVSRSPERFRALLAAERVTVLNQTPSAFDALATADAEAGGSGLALRTVIFGGEALEPSRLRGWCDRHPPGAPRLVNMYGITETTVHATHADVDASTAGSVVGVPLPGLGIHLLDPALRPVPDGVAGEIYLSGPQVTRGYSDRPALTATRFVAHPWGAPGERLYRSGDLARRGADGRLEYLGRIDDQVKIRGFRIEPAEVAAALRAHPGVAHAVVIARDDGPSGRRLVGYAVASPGVTPEELRGFLAERVPDHQVPAAVVLLDALPLTVNGKLDRAALPAPDLAAAVTGRAPATPQERTLADLFASVLGLERVGVDDSFFALGGDSLLSVQLTARARTAGLAISPRQVFERRTVAELAAHLVPDAVPDAAPPDGVGDAALTPIMHTFLARGGPFDRFSQGTVVEPDTAPSPDELERAVQALLDRHDLLRARLLSTPDGRVLRVPPPGTVPAASVVGYRTGDPDELLDGEHAAAVDRLDPVDGPVLQVVRIDGGGRCVLLVVGHHVVTDGYSWRILAGDLRAALEQARRGGEIVLEPVGTSLRAWVGALTDRAGERAAELDVWRGVLDGPDPVLGARRLDPAVDTRRTLRRVDAELSATVTADLLTTVPAAFRTGVPQVLLAALAVAVGRRFGARSLPVTIEAHGREDAVVPGADLARTVGWFTTQYPARLDASDVDLDDAVAGGPAADRLLKRVKEHLHTLPDNGIGYGILRHLHPATAGALDTAEPQILVNYVGRATDDRGGLRTAADDELPAPAALALDVVAVDGPSGPVLRTSWRFPSGVFDDATVRVLADEYAAALRGVAARRGSGGLTPSDVGPVPATQDDLDRWQRSHPTLTDVWPVSPLQHGLLFHAALDGDADPYTVQLRLELDGPLSSARLRAAVAALLDRNPVLRTAFVRSGDAGAVALVLDALAPRWRVTGEDVEAVAAAERATPFDPEDPPLLRFVLVRHAGERHTLLVTHHHLVLDGWSTPLLMRELCALYADPDPVPRTRPYRDFLAWLDTQDRDAARRAWAADLDGVTEPTLVAAGDDRGATAAPEELFATVAPDRATALRQMARAGDVTLSSILLAAWALVLGTSTGRDDVVFGTTVAGRPPDLPGVESMVGLFVNTVPVRVRLRPGATVTELVGEVHAARTALLDHQHLGLAEIQRGTAVPGPLFDSLLVFESFPFETGGAGHDLSSGLTGTVGGSHGFTHYPVTIMVNPDAGRLDLAVKYRAGALDRAGAAALLDRFRRVLDAIATAPGAVVRDVDLLDDADRAMLAPGEGDVVAGDPDTLCAMVERQVDRTPDAVALDADTGPVTFRELDERANRLAHRLIAAGAGPEVRVAVLLPRGPGLVVALLAVLKSGAAYLPVDPDLPGPRIEYVLTDGAPRAVVTTEPSGVAGHLTVVRPDEGGTTRRPVDADRAAPLRASNPAYVIYTSGSTGRPKGTVVAHAAVTGHLRWMRTAHPLEPGERVLHKTSAAFDVSVSELFWPLTTGGRLVTVPPGAHRDPDRIAATIAEHGVNVAYFVPSMLEPFLDAEPAPRCPSLHTVISSGEALPSALAARFAAALPGVTLRNLYGPTETTVHISHHTVSESDGSGPVPIGVPVWNSTLLVLDRWLRRVPPGVTGELYLAGDQLARGYLDRPGPTAERFVANPYGPPGSRLYRTGDLARFTRTGALHHLGRTDDQVKIRGFRIEPGEIEAVLAADPSVARCAVVARDDGPGTAHLAAYVVPAPGREPTADALRTRASGALPEYMVPSAFVVLDELPLGPTGKLDRRALPAPDRAASSSRDPVTAAERVLTGLFADVLRLERVGVDDSFFHLGGDSILSIQLVARAREAGLAISPRDVFTRRTVADLAAALPDPGPITIGDPDDDDRDTRPFPLTPIMVETLGRGRFERFSQSMLLTAPPGLTEARLAAAVQAVLDRHDALRVRLGDDGLVVEDHARASTLIRRVPVAGPWDAAATAEAIRREHRDAATRLDPSGGVALQVVWFDAGEADGRVLLTVHHLAVDGVSWRVLLPDLAAADLAAADRAADTLPAVGTSLRTWTRALAAGAHDPARVAELPVWEAVLADPGAQPGRRAADPARDVRETVRRTMIRVPTDTTEALLGPVPEAFHARVHEVLLAALALAAARHLAERDGSAATVLVSLEGHGREDGLLPGADLSRTVGWFTTLFPTRLDLTGLDLDDAFDGGPAAGDALRRVKEHLRSLPDNGAGYGLLRHLNAETGAVLRDLATPRVLFNYLGRYRAAPDAGDGGWAPVSGFGELDDVADPRMPVAAPLDIGAAVEDTPQGPRISATWTVAPGAFDPEHADRVAALWTDALDALTRHVRRPDTGGFTPSDMPLVVIEQDRLTAFERRWGTT